MLLALAAGLVYHLVNQGGVCRDSVFATEYAKAFDPQRGYGGAAERVSSHRFPTAILSIVASHNNGFVVEQHSYSLYT
jgi:hypothetical protein